MVARTKRHPLDPSTLDYELHGTDDGKKVDIHEDGKEVLVVREDSKMVLSVECNVDTKCLHNILAGCLLLAWRLDEAPKQLAIYLGLDSIKMMNNVLCRPSDVQGTRSSLENC